MFQRFVTSFVFTCATMIEVILLPLLFILVVRYKGKKKDRIVPDFNNVIHAVMFAAVSILVLVISSLGVAFYVNYRSDLTVAIVFSEYYVSALLGVLLSTPTLFSIISLRKTFQNYKLATQTMICFVLLICVAVVAFIVPGNYIGIYLTFPVLLYLTNLLGSGGAYFGCSIVGVISICMLGIVSEKRGRFDHGEDMIWLQGYLLVIFLTCVAFVEVFNSRDRAFIDVERKVIERTQELSHVLSQLNESQQLLKEALKSKSDFMVFLCHELRNPLHAIVNMSDFLLDSGLSDEQIQSIMAVRLSSVFMRTLINDVLDMNKFEAGKVLIEYLPVDLTEILGNIGIYACEEARKLNIQFDFLIQNPLPKSVETDPTRLQQIFYNLISNAIKFMKSKGTLKISFKVNQDEDRHFMEFDVEDSGIGMSKETISKLFQPYVQANISTSREYGGSGLGLAIVNQIIQNMNGMITVESEIHKGTKFTVKLPTRVLDFTEIKMKAMFSRSLNRSGSSIEKEHVDSSQITITALNSVDILHMDKELNRIEGILEKTQRFENSSDFCALIMVVDDSSLNRMILTKIFEQMSIQCISAINGLEANKLYDSVSKTREIDMTFMDINMPVMDGREASRLLRSKGYEKPIIASTANMITMEELNADGITDIAPKPFQKKDAVRLLTKYGIPFFDKKSNVSLNSASKSTVALESSVSLNK
jgi:signal transduction histidine kinase